MNDDTELAITFFTTLTVLANLAALSLVGLAAAAALARRPDATAPVLWQRTRRELTPGSALAVAWLVAAVCTSGSLYFSEVADFVPCRLCWIQRGFMYPLVAVLAVGGLALTRLASGTGAGAGGWATAAFRWTRRLGLAMTVGGAAVAVYHLLIERYPSLESNTSCSPTTPCSTVWFERLGFVTLPYMSLSGFVLIFTLLALARPATPTASEPTATATATATAGSSPDRDEPTVDSPTPAPTRQEVHP